MTESYPTIVSHSITESQSSTETDPVTERHTNSFSDHVTSSYDNIPNSLSSESFSLKMITLSKPIRFLIVTNKNIIEQSSFFTTLSTTTTTTTETTTPKDVSSLDIDESSLEEHQENLDTPKMDTMSTPIIWMFNTSPVKQVMPSSEDPEHRKRYKIR